MIKILRIKSAMLPWGAVLCLGCDASPRSNKNFAQSSVEIIHPLRNRTPPASGMDYVSGRLSGRWTGVSVEGFSAKVDRGGGFIAFVPVPRDGGYRIEVTSDYDTLKLFHPIASGLEPERLALREARSHDQVLLEPSELVRVAIPLQDISSAWVATPRGVHPLLPTAGAVSGRIESLEAAIAARYLTAGGQLHVARQNDTTISAIQRLDTLTMDPAIGVLAGNPWSQTPTEILGRLSPESEPVWVAYANAAGPITGRRAGYTRLRFDDSVALWFPDSAVRSRDIRLPIVKVGTLSLSSDGLVSELVIPVNRVPLTLVTAGAKQIDLMLVGVPQGANIPLVSGSGLIRSVTQSRPSTARSRYRIESSTNILGYKVQMSNTSMVLHIRHAPEVDARRPLEGIRVVIDPGHPPGGAVGPTGLREDIVTLDVAKRVSAKLRKRGALPILTRSTAKAVSLGDRRAVAERADAHAFVSIHLDATPDGANPLVNDGPLTLYFHPHSARLARAIHAVLDGTFRMQNRGLRQASLAVLRPSWYPSILCEGATLSVPATERRMRSEKFRDEYATAIADGLENFFSVQSE